MSDSAVKWLVWILASGAIAAGVIMILWALFYDRPRGRKRCPTCWYDMQGVATPALQCPECGRTFRKPAALLRTRRRYRWAVLGFAIALLGYAGVFARKALADGWPTAIPSTVFVMFWPFDEGVWLNEYPIAMKPGITPIDLEFRDRVVKNKLSGWQLRWWISRIESYARKHRRFELKEERDAERKLRETMITLNGTYADWNAVLDEVGRATGMRIDHTLLPADTGDPLEFASRTYSAVDLLDATDSRYTEDGRNFLISWTCIERTIHVGQLKFRPELEGMAIFNCTAIVEAALTRQPDLDRASATIEVMRRVQQLCEPGVLSQGISGSTIVLSSRELFVVGEYLFARDTPRRLFEIEEIVSLLTTCKPNGSAALGMDWDRARAKAAELFAATIPEPVSVSTVGDLVAQIQRLGLPIDVSPCVSLQEWLEVPATTKPGYSVAALLDAELPHVPTNLTNAAIWTLDDHGVHIAPRSDLDRFTLCVCDVRDLVSAQSGDASALAQQLLYATDYAPHNRSEEWARFNSQPWFKRSLTLGDKLIFVLPVQDLLKIEEQLAKKRAPNPEQP